MDGVYSDLRVLEISTGVAPAYVGRLWADLGAQVIAAEPAGGSPVRAEGPFPHGTTAAAYGGLYAYLGAGKRSITLDLDSTSDHVLFERLAANVDVVVQEVEGPDVDVVRPRYTSLSEANPALIMTVISPFGLSGPRRHWRATPLTLFAMSSRMRLHGNPDREPLQYGPDTVPFQLGATAAAAAATALAGRDTSGRGRLIDVAGLEALIANVDVITILTSFTGLLSRRGLYASLTYPCADGSILLSFRDTDIAGIAAAMGRPELSRDPRFADRDSLTRHKQEFEPILMSWLLQHTRAELFARLQANHVMCAPIFDFIDVLADPHYAARGFFRTVNDPILGSVTLPGTLSPAQSYPPFRSPPPTPGADTHAVLADILGLEAAEIDALAVAERS